MMGTEKIRLGLVWGAGVDSRRYAEGVRQVARERGDVVLRDWNCGRHVPPDLVQWSPDAVISYLPEDDPCELLEWLTSLSKPVVSLSNPMPLPVVGACGRDQAEVALSYARQNEYASVAFVAGDGGESTRVDDWRTLAQEAIGIAPHCITLAALALAVPRPDDEHDLASFLQDAAKPALVIALTDFEALHVLAACRRMGVQIPEDVSVLGGGDEPFAHSTEPPLSTLRYPKQAIGREAAGAVIDALGGPPLLGGAKFRRVPGGTIVHRETTRFRDTAATWVDEVLNDVRTRAAENLTVADLAQQHAVSTRTLTRWFKTEMGCTPAEAIRATRIEMAKDFLSSTDLSITDVAGRCGFNSLSQFNVLFKRYTNATPGDFRRGAEAMRAKPE